MIKILSTFVGWACSIMGNISLTPDNLRGRYPWDHPVTPAKQEPGETGHLAGTAWASSLLVPTGCQ